MLQKQETIVVCDAQNKSYIGEFVVESETGESVADGVVVLLWAKEIDVDQIKIVGSDSTNNQTGYKDGVILKKK